MKRTVFSVTLTGTDAFSFYMSASGIFTVDWGDGTSPQTITKPSVQDTNYSHSYSSTGNYVVRFSGVATGYSGGTDVPAITFRLSANKAKMTQIAGSLGAIFPTINGISPRFNSTFIECTGLTSLPETLFAGITKPISYMFYQTFYGCSGLTSLPAGLFSGITGAPVPYMFTSTFAVCSGLTSLPSGLFATINGAPAAWMFQDTFAACSGLTGLLPNNLFGTYTGAPAERMFGGTFYRAGISGANNGIWNLTGVSNTFAYLMFGLTFSECPNYTGASPTIAAGSSVKLWTHFSNYPGTDGDSLSNGAFRWTSKPSDVSAIPTGWK
jgi:hypothetical protein